MSLVSATIVLAFLTFLCKGETDKLLFVVEYARHGARYPKGSVFKWNDDPMGLTTAGVRQHYILGRELRYQYIETNKFLSPNYDPSQISVYATRNSRTIASAYAQLAGLYDQSCGDLLMNEAQQRVAVPPNPYNFTEWTTELGNECRTIPVQTATKMLEPPKTCPSVDKVCDYFDMNHAEEVKRYEQENFREVFADYAKVFNVLQEKMNTSYVSKLRDFLICILVEGKLWISESRAAELINKATPVYQYHKYDNYLNVQYEDYKVSKLLATNFLHSVRDLFTTAAIEDITGNHKTSLKFVMDVASDGLMHSILLQMKHNNDKKAVPFASVMFFELYRNMSRNTHTDSDYYVRFKFNNKINVTYSLNALRRLIAENTYTDDQYERYCADYEIDEVKEDPMPLPNPSCGQGFDKFKMRKHNPKGRHLY